MGPDGARTRGKPPPHQASAPRRLSASFSCPHSSSGKETRVQLRSLPLRLGGSNREAINRPRPPGRSWPPVPQAEPGGARVHRSRPARRSGSAACWQRRARSGRGVTGVPSPGRAGGQAERRGRASHPRLHASGLQPALCRQPSRAGR